MVLDRVGVLLVTQRTWGGQTRQFLDAADIHSVFIHEVGASHVWKGLLKLVLLSRSQFVASGTIVTLPELHQLSRVLFSLFVAVYLATRQHCSGIDRNRLAG